MTRAAELERKINTATRKQELCKGMAQRITPSLSSDRVSHTRNITASATAKNTQTKACQAPIMLELSELMNT